MRPASPADVLRRGNPRLSLYHPTLLRRNHLGTGTHPDLPVPHLGEDHDEAGVAAMLREQGFEPVTIAPETFPDAAEFDSEDEFAAAYFRALAAWHPEPPAAGLLLAAVYDSEAGPRALFVRELSP